MTLDEMFQRISQDPFAGFLGIELLELGEGYSRVAMTVGERMLNFYGMPMNRSMDILLSLPTQA